MSRPRSRRPLLKLLRATAAAATLALTAAGAGVEAAVTQGAGGGPSPAPEPLVAGDAARGLALLHSGRLGAAEEAFQRARREAPGDPAGPYGLALVAWWQAFLSGADPGAVARCHGFLDEVLEATGAAPRRTARVAFFEGRAYGTRSQLEALERRWLAAALDARRMRRALGEALERQPDLADAYLGLGLYDVLAADVPTAVRLLRTLLLLPGGNRDRGLERLRRAAEAGGPFAPEARLYLAAVRYGVLNDPPGALEELARLAAAFPANGYLPALAGYVYLQALGDAPAADRSLSRAMELAAPGESFLVWPARLLRARARYLAGMVPEALADLEALDRSPPRFLTDLRPRALLLRAHIQGQIGEVRASRATLDRILANPAWERYHGAARSEASRPHSAQEVSLFRANLRGRRLAAAGAHEAARRALRRVLGRHPGNPQTLYRLAEIDLATRRYVEAAETLTAVGRQAPPLPTWLAPWAWVKAGWALDALGRRQQAEAAYRQALAYRGRYDEGAVAAAEHFLQTPYRPPAP